MPPMLPIRSFSPAVARRLRAVLCDIDDTLTENGKLPAQSYAALWSLHEAGIPVVPVTGRPAGWCDLIVREWPVSGVIGENGAFAFWEQEGKLHRLYHPDVAASEVRERLKVIEKAVLAEVPGSRVAQDQPYRLFDLAIDFREEAPDLGIAAAERIRAVFERHGARAKVSSLHVNGWYGNYDKLAMVRLFLRARLNIDIAVAREDIVFCGDSPNDEPMFAFFSNSCGVANIARFESSIRHLPHYVSAKQGGTGFAEIVSVILEKRALR